MSKLGVTDVDRAVGQRIQKRRKELGMTAAELSERINLAQQQLSRYERGENKINVAHLVEIATVLNTSIDWFFIDCFSEERDDAGNRKFVPVSEKQVQEQLTYHLNNLSPVGKRGLLVFLDNGVLR